ncbi:MULTISPECIES: mevalonate kinase [unclassified Pseudactinotalea]|uniref:mevalonate kinase n=1 Tax=unclassified Pseudactinotalea TaxID=2649176 RepID=UPI00128E86D1|nr:MULTISPECIES: mevalonate kinase [unclassified Pseudactinotalea]MPV49215.1 mevalonate kinase [Pseudactinotalea sp. HY160]QGH68113.1 mevalonate kinase [Pseudactinotalea sp. HY158]
MTERISMNSMLSALPSPAAKPRATAPAARPVATGAAHAKAILLGEHAVVYGAPAIALPLPDLRAEVTVRSSAVPGIHILTDLYSGVTSDAPAAIQPVVTALHAALAEMLAGTPGIEVHVSSAIPYGRGLGSSAAVAAAVTRAVADLTGHDLSPDTCYDIVQVAERVAHANPSGLDARAVVAGHAIRFERGHATTLPIAESLTFVIADSGVHGSTMDAVRSVRARFGEDPAAVESLIRRLTEATLGAVDDLATGDLHRLGRRMTDGHGALGELGVSSTVLDRFVEDAAAAGALGAKLTGGGIGGCVLALADSPAQADRIAAALRAAGAPRTWTTTVPAA